MQDSVLQFVHDYGPILEDAKRRLIVIVVFFVFLFIVGFFASPYLLKALITYIHFTTVSYVVLSPFQLLSTSMDIGFFFAIVFSMPLVLAECYEFLADAFTYKEKKAFLSYLFSSVFFFILGFAYGGAVLYYAAQAVAAYNSALGLENVWDIDIFISQTLMTASLLGVLFEYPLLLWVMMRLGVIEKKLLIEGRRIAIAVTVIVVALLPPTDGLSLIIMSVPLLGMYELTLLLAPERKRQVVPTPVSLQPL